ncbi:hypothetical protein [Natronomonas sp.]|jgi:hypothetical protein|uniref:hypothetical protein n=1 Tax=Natronomonas sp. TaxID=2184060 RepID=UPI003989A631
MSEPVTVATAAGDRVTVTGVAYTDRTHDGTLRLYDADDTVIAEFPEARWTIHAEHVGE